MRARSDSLLLCCFECSQHKFKREWSNCVNKANHSNSCHQSGETCLACSLNLVCKLVQFPRLLFKMLTIDSLSTQFHHCGFQLLCQHPDIGIREISNSQCSQSQQRRLKLASNSAAHRQLTYCLELTASLFLQVLPHARLLGLARQPAQTKQKVTTNDMP